MKIKFALGPYGYEVVLGNITEPTSFWQPAVIQQELPLYKGITFYTIYGNYIGRLAAFVAAILFFYGIAKRDK